jgi:putative ABC transport system substrate-binding protein
MRLRRQPSSTEVYMRPIGLAVVVAVGLTLAPLGVDAQQPNQVRRIGVLMAHAESDPEFQAYLAAFREGLQELGWTEGRNIRIDSRWGALDDAESRQRAAKGLIALKPDIILTPPPPRQRCNKRVQSPLFL